jgi:molybdopterin-guanine dinucleotide biosynthesis protein A
MPAPLFGLVLAGGVSSRMGRDKAALAYHGRSQLKWTFDLVSELCAATFVSVRPDQRDEPTRAAFPQIIDLQPGTGPIAGIAAALQQHPKAAWLVVACDLPFITREVLANLIDRRDLQAVATAYRSAHDGFAEPLCAIWEPTGRDAVLAHVASGKQCPRKFLINANTRLIDLPEARALDNVNTSEEAQAASAALQGYRQQAIGDSQTTVAQASSESSGRPRGMSVSHNLSPATGSRTLTLRVQYYALFREQAGRSEETLETVATTPEELYRELQARYPFQLAQSQLKVAVNTDFRDWTSRLASGDTVVFIPPVAGG